MKNSFQELEVWQKAIDLGVMIYSKASQLPDSERFGLRSQLTRAAVSISSNIAEGHGRRSKADFSRFLRISLGSVRECQSQLVFASRLDYFAYDANVNEECERVARMLYALIKSLDQQPAQI